ncbi:Slam-dependent surface lipoprotein [Sphingobium yanoikuyae]|uniref:Slam-dependent surface lipoprotein n=1 Tax=Sphingobium yanoikuyae TaxID=13690 RepID=UPI00241FCA99|nr:Slam-dependent surface lipoprotein [Sphingobium yanoikuyae]
MKNVYLKIAAALLASVTLPSVAQAQVYGGSSDVSEVVVGESNVPFGPHTAGEPGISTQALGLTALVDFAGLQSIVGSDTNGVSTITPTNTPHGDLGYFHFAQAGSNDVWFGEWTSDNNVSSGDHTVYFAGQDLAVAPTTATTATYAVQGINDYGSNGTLLTGTLTANFNGTGGGTVGGSLTGHQTVSLTNVGISGATFSTAVGGSASIAGNAAAASGAFFGTNVAGIGGIVTVASDRSLDTAFAGSRTN